MITAVILFCALSSTVCTEHTALDVRRVQVSVVECPIVAAQLAAFDPSISFDKRVEVICP